jgi:hypothetical protein
MSDQPEMTSALRAEEDDLDLLTFTEAGIRLAEEIARTRAALGSAADEAGRRAQTERLEALLEAQRRNRRPALDGEAFERFFGYRAG